MRFAVTGVAAFSGVINLLGLTGSFYMLQVYDRVLASRSVATLVAISLLALGLFVLQGGLEVLRGQVLHRIGAWVERELLQPVHALLMRLPLAGRSAVESTQPVRDMEAIRNFMSSAGPVALLDLPWMPLYVALIFLLHPWLGVLSLAGMAVLVVLALLSEVKLKEPIRQATHAAGRRQQIAETVRGNVEVIRAMGFSAQVANRFYAASRAVQESGERVADISGVLGTTSKIVRIVLQSAILGLGAYLVLQNQVSGGAIIASSILSGRALAPVEQAVAHWKGLVASRQAWRRLDELIRMLGDAPRRLDLPDARETLQVEGVTLAAPGGRVPLVRNASFTLQAGDALAVIGPSGSGKSTLVRALSGAWPLLAGHVRLDGAPLEQWPEERLGRLIGYLPQDVELFDGTIAENIARLDPDAKDEDIVLAAKAANVHEMILRLPNGYSTALGEGGHNLSVGQRQRIGLARALFGNPFLIILDEPNAHLDQEGDRALLRAISDIRARGGIVIIVSHRRDVLAGVNFVAVVKDGEIKSVGPRDEVLKALAAAQAGALTAAAPQPPPQQERGTVSPFPGTGANVTVTPARVSSGGSLQQRATLVPVTVPSKEGSSE